MVNEILLQEEEVFGGPLDHVHFIQKFPNEHLMKVLKDHFKDRITFWDTYSGPEFFDQDVFASRNSESPLNVVCWDDGGCLFSQGSTKKGHVEQFTETIHHRNLLCLIAHQRERPVMYICVKENRGLL